MWTTSKSWQAHQLHLSIRIASLIATACALCTHCTHRHPSPCCRACKLCVSHVGRHKYTFARMSMARIARGYCAAHWRTSVGSNVGNRRVGAGRACRGWRKGGSRVFYCGGSRDGFLTTNRWYSKRAATTVVLACSRILTSYRTAFGLTGNQLCKCGSSLSVDRPMG